MRAAGKRSSLCHVYEMPNGAGHGTQIWHKETPIRAITGWHLTAQIARQLGGERVTGRRRLEDRCVAMGEPVPADAFVFSLAPDNSTYMRPSSVSECYSDLADRLGIATSLHKLRHYSATELIAAGSTSAPWRAGSGTAAAEPPRCGSMPRGCRSRAASSREPWGEDAGATAGTAVASAKS